MTDKKAAAEKKLAKALKDAAKEVKPKGGIVRILRETQGKGGKK